MMITCHTKPEYSENILYYQGPELVHYSIVRDDRGVRLQVEIESEVDEKHLLRVDRDYYISYGKSAIGKPFYKGQLSET
jgi:hypothetical protein